MSKPIGGTCYFKVDGAQLELLTDDDPTIVLQPTLKEGLLPGYYTERDVIPSIEAEFIVPKDFPMQTLLEMTEGTVTLELKSGRTALLSGAYLAGEASVAGGKGTVKLKFEGQKGEWI